MRRFTKGASLLALLLAAPLATTGPAHAAASATPGEAARASAAPTITIEVSNNEVMRGKRVVVTGAVTSDRIERVTLQQKRAGKRWKDQDTAKVKADGSYRLSDKTTTATTRNYRVVSADGPRAVSPKAQVGVYEWRDLTDVRDSQNTGWVRTKKGFTTRRRSLESGYIIFKPGRPCITLRARFGLADRSDSAGLATISVHNGTFVPLFADTYGRLDSESVRVRLPKTAMHKFFLFFRVENPAGLARLPAAYPLVTKAALLCTTA